MRYSRRKFLKSLLAAAAVGATFHPLSALAAQEQARSCLIVASDKSACFVDLKNLEVKRTNAGFRSHSFLPHPHHPMRFLAMEKWGSLAAEIDFSKGTSRGFTSGSQHRFYGHAYYIEEHKAFFMTRVDEKTGLGYLTGYDPETYKILHNFQITAGGLHDCHRMADKILMVASSGLVTKNYGDPEYGIRAEPSALVRVDMVNGGKVVGRLSIEDPEQIIGHFAVTRAGQILALGGPVPSAKRREGDLFYSPDGIAPLRRLEFPSNLFRPIRGEMLSVALNADHRHAAVTNPDSRQVLLVDMKEGKILKSLPQPARNMAFDPARNKFVGGQEKLVFIDPAFAFQTPTELANSVRLNGPHSLLEQIKS